MPLPESLGLYDPQYEHDACGLGMVANLKDGPSHEVVRRGLEILVRLAHRGAAGADPLSSDGSGILLQLPHDFFSDCLAQQGIELPEPGDYGVIMAFLPQDIAARRLHEELIETAVARLGQHAIGWRDVPVDSHAIGPVARKTQPMIRQFFVGRRCPAHAFERVLFTIRKRAGKQAAAAREHLYIASCSSRTVVYKGLVLPQRLAHFYEDLRAPNLKSSLALVHSRFSTNTFPTWERAHPYRRIAHNGEINTLRGNSNWMRAREANLGKAIFGPYVSDFKSVIRAGGSDSASLDNVVDFLLAGGRSLPHVMMMLIPEARNSQREMPDYLRDFYAYHGALVEPWDGPAAVMFTDGRQVGAILDRNGLRPAKYIITKRGFVIAASELGVFDVAPSEIIEQGRLRPGEIFIVDTVRREVLKDQEVKRQVAQRRPYGEWLRDNKIDLASLPDVPVVHSLRQDERLTLQRAFGYTKEDLDMVLAPMAQNAEEPIGSMGHDGALAVLSEKPQLLFRYFKQQFAQVTNPAIDPIRESMVMSLISCVGSEGNLLDETPEQCRMLELPHPILSNAELAKLARNPFEEFEAKRLPILFDARAKDPLAALTKALDDVCDQAEQAIDVGYNLVILSDRGVSEAMAAIPSLLAVGAVHYHLIRAGKRVRAGLIIESAEPRQVADIALLIGYGAGAVNPYLAFDSLTGLVLQHHIQDVDVRTAERNYVVALKKGLLKIMAKMGISTLSSYHGAQIFEAIGISQKVIDSYFTGTSSVVDGIGLREIANETLQRHARAFGPDGSVDFEPQALDVGGEYAWRRRGEVHLWTPDTIAKLQQATRQNDGMAYKEYARLINDQREHPVTLRGLWEFVQHQESVPLDEVEPASEIVKRFCTGAMSFGSISAESHETLAIAMNRIGAKSNSGEGGEDPARFGMAANGDSRNSAIKQVASGRFGVTTQYLVNADELQIKIAQGAKPGEGGQLPGHKVDPFIAKVRHSTPGVGLISPPPHHDIYSIEDLSQLIFDLKQVNCKAQVSVKLVAESGVGTIAAGVAKADADIVYIAGHDGGTGASPLSSIYHAGTPWELGLAETHQVLTLNNLRSRVKVVVDGQLKTGRDVAFAALMGADGFGVATAALVSTGCIMMRKCHLNTCPVGIATQDPQLRKRFTGQPEHVINLFFLMAEELREIMAQLGFRTVDEMVGRVDCIRPRAAIAQEKARTLKFDRVLRKATIDPDVLAVSQPPHGANPHPLPQSTLLASARVALEAAQPVRLRLAITNAHRTFGADLAGEIARRYGAAGLPEGTVHIDLRGVAGQSFGAFAVAGMTLNLEGAANDYVGKGLSGGIVVVRPPHDAGFVASDNAIVGNTVLYGATYGKAFIAGQAGERFAVRNSGAIAVVEGVGDHGCEYMTGGAVIVLGPTGSNFAAGMSGGVSYVLDASNNFGRRVNMGMVELDALDDDDADFVARLLKEHQTRTASAKAAALLHDFASVRNKFVKVMPIDFKRALQVMNTTALKVVSHG